MAAHPRRRTAVIVVSLFVGLATAGGARADNVPSIVVTPYFLPTSIAKAGSTVSVITADQIAQSSAGSVADLLSTVPGVTVTQSGGVGGQTLVSLRGAEPGHTLVLIDGVRVNDPASARDEFDFATLAVTDIARIEILRGPQSALYGSDAMGGVINIITKRPSGAMHGSATVEAGSYGTVRTTVSAGGTSGPLSLQASGTYFSDTGFSRVGNRDQGEPDGTDKLAGTVRGTFDAGDGTRFEFGLDAYHQASKIDETPGPYYPNGGDLPGYTSTRDLVAGFGRLLFPTMNGSVASSLTFFATDTSRDYGEPTKDTFYRGTDSGAEYQGNLRLGSMGSLLVGARVEQVTASEQVSNQVAPAFDESKLLYAGYLLYQLPVDAHLNLSFAARHDGEVDGQGFTTGRFTAVYDLPAADARIHASIGTGAKRPTVFQLSYNPDLLPEQSVGADLGLDKTLLDGRLTTSVTGYWNRFENLIDWDPSIPPYGNYANITEAETAGVEATVTARLIPGKLTSSLSYTYLYSRNLATGLPLKRRPAHSGQLSLTYTGIANLEAGVAATLVGTRFNDAAATVKLPAYVRVDLNGRYRVNDALSVFARVENLFNADYQEASGYNTAGLSAYAGLTWKH